MKFKPGFLTNHWNYVMEGFPWHPMQSANLSWVPLLCARNCCRDCRWASKQIIAVLGAGGYSLGYVWNVLGAGREHWLILSQEGWGWFHTDGACMLSHFSPVRLFVTPWTVACQAPLSMEFFRWEYWSGLIFPPLGDLPNSEIEPASLTFPALASGFFTTSVTWEAHRW